MGKILGRLWVAQREGRSVAYMLIKALENNERLSREVSPVENILDEEDKRVDLVREETVLLPVLKSRSRSL